MEGGCWHSAVGTQLFALSCWHPVVGTQRRAATTDRISMQKINKTNAARLLDKAGIEYRLIPYSYSEEDLSAQHVAAELGEDIAAVFKTLVLRGDKTGLFVCVIPGNHEVDLKAAAKLSGNKSCALIHQKELLPLTGYIRGGCSPIGMKKPLPTFIHLSALDQPRIFISAGVRGLQIEIAPQDLISYTGATPAACATPDA